jgi:hypothetical protein
VKDLQSVEAGIMQQISESEERMKLMKMAILDIDKVGRNYEFIVILFFTMF